MESEQAVIVYLRGIGLPDAVYQEFDVATLEDQLIEAIAAGSLGEFDGNEFGPEGTVLYLYGPDAEKLYAGIAPILTSYPLCQQARVIVRSGPPGSPEHEIHL